jgi:hypothetical protein
MASDQYATFLTVLMADTMQLSMICSPSYLSSDSLYHTFAASKKKYKPIALKVCLVITDLPDHFHIVCNITGDPLKNNVSLAEALFNRATDQQPTAPEDD